MAVRGRPSMVVLVSIAWLLTAVAAAAQEIRPTLDKIRETGSIDLGYREAAAPFSFLDKDGKPAGYSVDLCQQTPWISASRWSRRCGNPCSF
jgi:ABC-type amino acid transport substrate-binding protein